MEKSQIPEGTRMSVETLLVEGDYTLPCAYCGSDNLHFESIRIVQRGEDKPGNVHDFNMQRPDTLPLRIENHPPEQCLGRQQSVIFQFSCEVCDNHDHLTLWEHKGWLMVSHNDGVL